MPHFIDKNKTNPKTALTLQKIKMSLIAIGFITFKAKRKYPNYLVPKGPSQTRYLSSIEQLHHLTQSQ